MTLAASAAGAQTLVERGAYLINTVMACNSCHTPFGPNGPDLSRLLSGGRTFDEPRFKAGETGHDFTKAGRGGTVFKGPFGESISANLTSHPTKGLGGWSDEEIKRAVTQGISRDGRRLKPPMAYAAYAHMTPQDQNALVAFLRTLPALD